MANDPPDIRRAWNYFYGRTLPRREVEEKDEFDQPMAWRKLEAVEPGGELYSLATPMRELGDFGLGVGLYFSSRFAMVIMFSLIGFLNAFTIMAYYRSDAFAGEGSKDSLSYDLRTSAICERTVKVCMDWECKEKSRRSDCPMLMFEDGFMDIVSVGILLSYLALVTMSQQHIADNVDVREQTASDYSIVVEDPDPHATDPEEWRRYFTPFGHVTYVSVGVNNGLLLQLLARKRSVLMQLHREAEEAQQESSPGAPSKRMSLVDRVLSSAKASHNFYETVEGGEPLENGKGLEGTSTPQKGGGLLSKMAHASGGMSSSKRASTTRSDWAEEDEKHLDEMVEKNLNSEAAQTWRGREEELAVKEAAERDTTDTLWMVVQRLGFFQDSKYFRAEMYLIEREIAVEMEKGPAKAAKVFITFETECAQREALRTMKVGLLSAKLNLDMRRRDRFRYSNVLTIEEAPEPRDIMWCELNTTPLQLAMSLLEGVVACTGFILLAYALLLVVQGSPFLVGVMVAVLNMAVAPLMIAIASRERHLTRQSEHVWLLGKLVATRWCISVVLIKSIIPFAETLSAHSIATVRYVVICDAFFKPIIQALDLPGIIDHYVLAAFAPSQEKMNRLFLGARWSLTERYSDMGKSIFVALSFAAIYPFGYWMCAAANLMSFLSDKYCLFRVWRPMEPENAAITSFHRATLAIAFFFHCVFTLWYFSDWPFDDVCAKGDGLADGEWVPDWVADNLKFHLQDSHVYKRCDMQHDGWLFGIRGGRAYMTPSQITLILLYKSVTILTFLAIAIVYFGPGAIKLYQRIFVGHVLPTTSATEVAFSEVEFIEGYIPGLVDPLYNKPLLGCGLGDLHKDHIHWEGNWEAYNLHSHNDFPGLSEQDRDVYFGKVKYYPPSEGGAKGTYGDYIQQNLPELLELLHLDAPEEETTAEGFTEEEAP